MSWSDLDVARISELLDLSVTGRVEESAKELWPLLGTVSSTATFRFGLWPALTTLALGARAARQPTLALKITAFSTYWHLDAYHQSWDRVKDLVGVASPTDRRAIAEAAIQCAEDLDLDQVVVPFSGDTVHDIVFNESQALGVAVDYLRRPAPAPNNGGSDYSVEAVTAAAESGDVSSQVLLQCFSETSSSKKQEVMEQAAQLGNIVAMVSLADVAYEMGRPAEERAWIKEAAGAGDPLAMVQLGRFEYEDGNTEVAEAWLQRAGGAGCSSAYGVLFDMALDTNDGDAAIHWADVGAGAGDPKCLASYAMRLCGTEIASSGGVSAETTYRAHRLLTQAALLGYVRAMTEAAVVSQGIEHTAQALYWLHNACERGDTVAPILLEQWT